MTVRMAELPYLTAPGSVDTGLDKVRTASEPTELTTTSVGDQLGLKGGTGANFVRLLKKLGMIGEGGRPTDSYRKFRGEKNRSVALADGIRSAYAPLFQRVQEAHKLPKEDLLGLVREVTGAASDSRAADFTVATFQRLCKYAEFNGTGRTVEEEAPPVVDPIPGERSDAKRAEGRLPPMMLANNIHLNLPDTTDIRVFDAIFRSLREHLLR